MKDWKQLLLWGMFIAYVVFSMIGLTMLYNDKQQVKQRITPTYYDMTVQCQTMASQATNEGWSYKSCLEELERSVQDKSKAIMV